MASFCGGAVGVLSALLVVELNNADEQVKTQHPNLYAMLPISQLSPGPPVPSLSECVAFSWNFPVSRKRHCAVSVVARVTSRAELAADNTIGEREREMKRAVCYTF